MPTCSSCTKAHYNLCCLNLISNDNFASICGNTDLQKNTTDLYLPCVYFMYFLILFNPLTDKLNNLNFHPLKVVSRYRDPQLQVGENYSHLFNLRANICKS